MINKNTSSNRAQEFTERRVQLATRAIELLTEYLDLFEAAIETLSESKKFDHATIKDIGFLTSRLVEVIKLVSKEDLSDLEPSLESILEQARAEFANG